MPRASSTLDRLQVRFARRAADALRDDAVNGRSRGLGARATVMLLALAVHAFTAIAVVGGLVAAAIAWPNWILSALALLLVAIGVAGLPRRSKLDPAAVVVGVDEMPALHALVAEVADATAVPAPRVIALHPSANAWVTRIGWPGLRRDALVIGVPLLAACAPRERVALIAHELAHLRGDVRRTSVVVAAWTQLASLAAIFDGGAAAYDPTRHDPNWAIADSAHGTGAAKGFARVMLAALRGIVVGYLVLLALVEARDRQRAEYRADRHAADVAGPEASVAMLRRSVATQAAFDHLVSRAGARGGDGGASLVAEIVAEAGGLPADEIDRRIRQEELVGPRLGASHPPIAFRIAAARAGAEHAIALTGAYVSDALDAEIARCAPEYGQRLARAARAALYA